MRHSTRSPSACQKVIWRHPRSGGSSQFHRCSTTSPPMKVNSTIARIASGAIIIILFTLGLMFGSSCFHKFVVNVVQALAQMQHRIALAREQRIHDYMGSNRAFALIQSTVSPRSTSDTILGVPSPLADKLGNCLARHRLTCAIATVHSLPKSIPSLVLSDVVWPSNGHVSPMRR